MAEAFGLTLPHSALAPSGEPVWLDMARRSARALLRLHAAQTPLSAILTPAALENAMLLHAAFGGSTNLLLHIPALAHAAGLRAPDRRRLDPRQPRDARGWSTRCRTGRAITRPCRCSWRAACPR